MPLKILVVGAGLVGLSTAIALAQKGHDVEIYEKSRFRSEVGAAFHILPTAFKLMRDEWKLDVESMRPVVNSMWRFLDSDTLETKSVQYVLAEKLKELGTTDPQVMVFRIDAHNLLKQHAESMPNITMHLGNGLVSVDTANASIKLSSGEERSGDLVVGADGIHSLTLQSVDASAAPTSRMGMNMYRFLVPAAKAKQDTEVSALLDQIGFFDGVGNNIINASTKNSVVIYPCRGCELVNVLTFQAEADEKTKLPEDDYNCPGTPEDVQHLLRNWPQKFQALAGMAEDVKHWAAVTRDVPSTYVKDRLVLVGDSAHPTMPKLGAGAGMGMEDAATLATLLDGNTTREDLPKRLELYNQLRYPRSVTCKYASEIFKLGFTQNPDEAAQDLLTQKIPGALLPTNPPSFLWKYDVVQEAKNALAAAA